MRLPKKRSNRDADDDDGADLRLGNYFASDGGCGLADVGGCLAEMRAFQRGGIGGLARLHAVLPSLWIHYRVPPPAHRKLLARMGLRAYTDTLTQRISFYLPSQQQLLTSNDEDDDRK